MVQRRYQEDELPTYLLLQPVIYRKQTWRSVAIAQGGFSVGHDLACGGGPVDSMEYWYYLFVKLCFVISEDYGRVVGEVGQSGDRQSTLYEWRIGIFEEASETASLKVLKSPQFWAMRSTGIQNSSRSSRAQGDTMTAKTFEMHHPNFSILKVQKLNNNIALPKRSIVGAAGYYLCASQNCPILAGGKGLV